jgi:hypothetical protein
MRAHASTTETQPAPKAQRTCSSESPPLLWIVMLCSLAVARSLALTCTIPLASMSKVTSIWGTPRGAGGMPTRSNWPSMLLSPAISRSPWKTLIPTYVGLVGGWGVGEI